MNNRTIVVSRPESGRTVIELLRERLRLSWSEAKRRVQERCVRLNGKPCNDPACRVKAGQRLEVLEKTTPGPRQRKRTEKKLAIVFADAHIVVVDKPAGITTMRHPEETAEFGHRARRFLPPTLADQLPEALAKGHSGKRPRVRPVHRLDKDTSGLVVFALTVEAERRLGLQFRAHTIERRYLAIVRGKAKEGRIESYLARDRGDGRRGSGSDAAGGQRAVTHLRIVEELGDYTLVECRLETGRTHQVRIHLGESGTPLCGERVYDRLLHGKPRADRSGFTRPALHAASLGLEHPATGKRLTWTSALPRDMQELLEKLRGK